MKSTILLMSLLQVGTGSLAVKHERPLSKEVAVSIATTRSGCYASEVPEITVTLKHFGKQARWGHFNLSANAGLVDVQLRPAGGEFRTIRQPNSLKDKSVTGPLGDHVVLDIVTKPRRLEPGEELVNTLMLGLDEGTGRSAISVPGRYELRVTYREETHDATPALLSNIVTFDVLPAPNEERMALAEYSRDVALVAQAEPGDVTSDQISAAAKFLERFPQSLYAAPVRRGLLNALDHRRRTTEEERALYQKLKEEERQARLLQGLESSEPAP
jgi:hypothetical protein